MAFRDIPRDIKDEKDMESFHRALRDKAVSITYHSELKDIKEVDKSSTDTSRDKHVSDYDMKKVEDHMDDVSKHLAQELTGGANYIDTINAGNLIDVTVSGKTRTIDVEASVSQHITDITTNPHAVSDANLVTTDVTTNNVSTSTHGFCPKLPNDVTKYLDGVGNYTVPPTGTTYTGGKNIVVFGSSIDLAMESGCHVYRASAQSINDSTTTVIQYSTEEFDTGNEYDTGTYKFTAAVSGKRLIIVSVSLDNVATNKTVEVVIRKNGSEVARNGTRAGDDGGGSSDVRLQVSRIIDLAATDYIEGAVYHEHGSARNTLGNQYSDYMSIAFIG